MGIDALNDLNRRARARGAELRGRRVLGPEIDGEIAESSFGHTGLTSAGGATPAIPVGSETLATAEPLEIGVPRAFSQGRLNPL